MGAERLAILRAHGRLTVLHHLTIFRSRRRLLGIVELPLEINLLHLVRDVAKHLPPPDRLVVLKHTLGLRASQRRLTTCFLIVPD